MNIITKYITETLTEQTDKELGELMLHKTIAHEDKPKFDHDTIQTGVVDYIRNMILQGYIQPGIRIRQADLANELGISTTPVREALRHLVSHGLLDFIPHRGVMVHRTTREELIDVYEMRIVLEGIALKSMAERITLEEVTYLESLLEEMEDEDNLTRWYDLNTSFHAALNEASGRSFLASTLSNLQDISALYVITSIRNNPDRIRLANKEHRQILLACKNRDLEGLEKAHHQHLKQTLQNGLASLA